MDIELVKKAQKAFEWYDKAVDNSIDYLNLEREEQQDAWNALDKLFEAIARQSVKSEEVADVIKMLDGRKWGLCLLEDGFQKEVYLSEKEYETVITALQAYQPTTRKNRTVEEVAEAIEYVSDWRKESMTFDRAVGILPTTSEEIRAYDTILTALQAYQPWISVEDRLPTEDDADGNANVMCLFADNAIETWAWNEITEWNLDDARKEQVFAGITHWRPMLPKPPKGE